MLTAVCTVSIQLHLLKVCSSCLKGKRCEDTSVIDYELIDIDARVSAGDHW